MAGGASVLGRAAPTTASLEGLRMKAVGRVVFVCRNASEAM
ncbi:hypothetical protein BRCON_2116 [Candidatus Sumerlaea chitinivorans]|uniref:Uncharacterized protein n=1 Tax=Sumerlaea chitinivorans TaxID=2250252 RepID=A0A2Z4Y8W3_SUMC1|nr:hypothetical protein BRCON_2116 [Candidatus Sumerlaea chitinivorans]